MSKKQLYIHIGVLKTGTTSLQVFLKNHANELLEQGVLHPTTIDYHRILTHYPPEFKVRRTSSELPRPGFPWNENKKPNFSPDDITKVKKDFDDEIENSTATKVIISNELLSWELSPSEWDLMRTLCNGYETFIVVYFRRQDEFLISYYNQLVKRGLDIKEPLISMIENDHFQGLLNNHEKMLHTWSDIVGDDHIIVRSYEGNAKNDVINDFLKCVGVEYKKKIQPSEYKENITPPYTLTKLKYLLNSCFKENETCHAIHEIDNLNPFAELLSTLQHHQNRNTELSPLSPQKRQKILNKYAEMNNRIAQKYLDSEKLFDDLSIDENALFDESTNLSLEETREILTVLFADYAKSRHLLYEILNTIIPSLVKSQEELNLTLNQSIIENQYNSKPTRSFLINLKRIISYIKRKTSIIRN